MRDIILIQKQDILISIITMSKSTRLKMYYLRRVKIALRKKVRVVRSDKHAKDVIFVSYMYLMLNQTVFSL